MTDRPQPEPTTRPVAPGRLKEFALLKDLEIHPAVCGEVPLIVRDHDEELDLLLSTNMVSHGVDLRRLRALVAVSAWLRDLGDSVGAEDEPKSSRLMAGEDVARFLLRTTETACGIPWSTSGLLHGLAPTPPTFPLVLVDGQRYSDLAEVVSQLPTGSGKTQVLVEFLAGRLTTRLDRLHRGDRAPTALEAAHIADDAYALSALLLHAAQRILATCVGFVGHLVVFAPNECSPVGVLRLASPRVPRAPGVAPVTGPTEIALAA